MKYHYHLSGLTDRIEEELNRLDNGTQTVLVNAYHTGTLELRDGIQATIYWKILDFRPRPKSWGLPSSITTHPASTSLHKAGSTSLVEPSPAVNFGVSSLTTSLKAIALGSATVKPSTTATIQAISIQPPTTFMKTQKGSETSVLVNPTVAAPQTAGTHSAHTTSFGMEIPLLGLTIIVVLLAGFILGKIHGTRQERALALGSRAPLLEEGSPELYPREFGDRGSPKVARPSFKLE